MIVKDDTTKLGQIALGACVLLVGVAIGFLARPETWRHEPPQAIARVESQGADRLPDPTQPPMKRAETIPDEKDNGLPTLYIDLEPKAAARLQAVRDRAHARGQIFREENDLVPATIRLDGEEFEARVRIKGDFLDHLHGDKWSLRIELKGDKLFGMSRMSIQSPAARGYLWEWLVMETARRQGLLAPRSMFVNVVVNNNPTGIYYLEEHFSKELLESQARREGPIVKFDESVRLSALSQYGFNQGIQRLPETVQSAMIVTTADISAFSEKTLAQSESLARQLQEAIVSMRTLQELLITHPWVQVSSLAKISASFETKGKTFESILDMKSMARMHALLSLFRSSHALFWPNRRFYHNPVTNRLEPIIYDVEAGTLLNDRDPIELATLSATAFLESDVYYNELFRHLGTLAAAPYLDELFRDIGPDLRKYAELLRAEGFVVPQTDVDLIFNQLHDQQVFLRELLRPIDGVNFNCRFQTNDFAGDKMAGMIEVEAWATTKIPVIVSGFRFGNDRFVRARHNLVPGGPTVSYIKSDRSAVILPNDGRHVVFRFPIDERLATLGNIKEMKAARKKGQDPDLSVNLSLQVEYRYIGANEPKSEQLSIRRFGQRWRHEGGRPEPPTLTEPLDRHTFLSYDADSDELFVKAGEWDVEDDLVVPTGHALRIGPGVTLRFDWGAAIVTSDALLFSGTAESPIVLEPKRGVPEWAGVVVLEASGQSTWHHVQVRDTNVIKRGGWNLTGGVTFYRSAVDLYDCTFRSAHGEDALNIVDCDFLLERVTFDGVASDAFDGDFVTGTIRSCTFLRSVEDAVDVSGSNVQVIDSRFIDIGDKCISAGENSTVRVRGGVVESASIAIASKDSSHVDIADMEVRHVENYVLAAYIKKPEYGPSTIIAANLTIGEVGRGLHLVQAPCEIELDGESIAGVEVDVKDLYDRKILGK